MSAPAGATPIDPEKPSPRHATVEDRDALRISHRVDHIRHLPAAPVRDRPQVGTGAVPPRDGGDAAGHLAPRPGKDADHRRHGRSGPPPARRTVDPRPAFLNRGPFDRQWRHPRPHRDPDGLWAQRPGYGQSRCRREEIRCNPPLCPWECHASSTQPGSCSW